MEPEDRTTRHPNPIGSPIEETATEARQGRKGTPVLKVLVAALILAAIAWAGAEWWGESTDPPAEQKTATPPAGENTPGSSGAAPSNEPVTQPNVPATNDRPSGNP